MFQEVLAQWESHKGITSPPREPIRLWSSNDGVLYIEDSWGPAVPYPPVDHSDGAKNHGYIRLKGNARVVNQLPEAQGWKDFQEFLLAINADDSPIESVGCEKGYFLVEDIGAATVKLGSYVDVIFTDVPMNEQPEKLLLLATHLMESVKGCHQWWGAVEIGLQRLRVLYGSTAPWGLMIRLCNYGRSEEEARRFWGETLVRMGKAISNLPQDFCQGD